MDAALHALERELRAHHDPSTYEFVVIGGASLLLRGLGARATSDVDVLGSFDGRAVSPAAPTDAELMVATRWMQSLYGAGDAALVDAERIIAWLRALR